MSGSVTLDPNSEQADKIRRLATKPVPGKHSALYYLNAKILQREPLVPMTYRAHLAMCLFAENATGIPEIDNARIKMILVPRGLGKSTLVTKGRPILKLLQNRNHAVGIANEKQDLANTFLGDIKAELESNDLLKLLWPDIVPPNTRDTIWAADRIIVNRDKMNPTSPSVLATGVGATVTGVHMDEWIVDDLISQNAAEAAYRGNFSEIEAADRWVARLQPLLKSPKRDSIFFIGTHWWEGDTYFRIMERWSHGEPWKKFKWTLRYPAQRFEWDGGVVDIPAGSQQIELQMAGEIAVFKRAAIDENGRAIFPERYDLEELEMLAQEDPVFYAGQYLLEPTAGAASAFNTDDLKFYEWESEHQIRYRDQLGKMKFLPTRELTTFISVDPAFSKKQSSARTAIPVVATNGSELFLMEDFAERLESEDDIAAHVLEFYQRYKPRKIFVETIVAQVAVANAIRRRFREEGLPEPPIEEIRSHGQQKKVMRIFGLEHYFKRGLFYIHRSHQKFLGEYQTFPRGELRDLLDALAFQKDEWERVFTIQHFQGDAGRNPQSHRQAEARAKERIRQAWGRRRGRR